MPIVDATRACRRRRTTTSPASAWSTATGRCGGATGSVRSAGSGGTARSRAIPGGPLHDLGFDRVVPRHVLTGFQPWEYAARVHAGVVVGWVHKPAVTIGERPFGQGKLTATTFRLCEDAPGADPLATTLLDALIETAKSSL